MSATAAAAPALDHRRLQRALMIALHDDVTHAALVARDGAALDALDLGPAERSALLAVDPRALRTDPSRATRLLGTLAGEYRASTTLLLAAGLGWRELSGFFADPSYRDAVLSDRLLVLAFGTFLAARPQADGLLADVITLEIARARCQRERHRAPVAQVGLAPGVALIEIHDGALALLHATERWLFELGQAPQRLLAADAPRPPAPPSRGAPLTMVVQPLGDDVAFSPVDDDLVRMLTLLATPRTRPGASDALVQAGVPRARVAELLEALAGDGLVALA